MTTALLRFVFGRVMGEQTDDRCGWRIRCGKMGVDQGAAGGCQAQATRKEVGEGETRGQRRRLQESTEGFAQHRH
jgi:hypothetical protein